MTATEPNGLRESLLVAFLDRLARPVRRTAEVAR
jgi:hypothetical protein